MSLDHICTMVISGNTVFCVVKFNRDTPSMDRETILSCFYGSSFAHCQLQIDDLDTYVNTLNKRIADCEQLAFSVVKFPIAEALDAEIEIDISEDKITAAAVLVTAKGGAPVSVQQIKSACIKAGIKYGLKLPLVKVLIAAARSALPGSKLRKTIVVGKPIEPGKDAYLQPLVTVFAEQSRNPTIYQDGSFNLRDLGKIDSVKIGQTVARKIPATEGQFGIDIFGHKLPAPAGEDFELTSTDSTEVAGENQELLVATKQGMLRHDGQQVVVDDVYTVTELTAQEGHIVFDGTVIVEKDVASEMVIDATGDVFIGGFVQSAKIKSGGDITIVGGCTGKKQTEQDGTDNYSCELQGGNITVDFVSSSQIQAKKNLIVHKQINNAKVTATSLLVGDEAGAKGKIIGGEYLLSEQLCAGEIGNDSDIPVYIDLSRELDEILRKDLLLWQKLETLDLQKVETATNSEYQLDVATVRDIKNQLQQLTDMIAKAQRARQLLQQQKSRVIAKAQVIANGAIHPNVTVKIGTKSMTINDKQGPSKVFLADGKLLCAPA